MFIFVKFQNNVNVDQILEWSPVGQVFEKFGGLK